MSERIQNVHEKWYKGIKYKSTLEAETAEALDKMGLPIRYEERRLTLIEGFRCLYQKDKVKNTTLYTYVQRRKYFKVIEDVKLHELTVVDYKLWRNSLDDSKLASECGYFLTFRYKPDEEKFYLDSKNVDFSKYEEFLMNENRYVNLKRVNEAEASKLLEEQKQWAIRRYEYYKRLDVRDNV